MAVVLRNERSTPYYLGSGTFKQVIASGAIATVSEEEWSQIITANRGPGQLNPLYPTEPTSGSLKINLEYAAFFGSQQILYYGTAPQVALDTDLLWTVKKFNYVQLSDASVHVSQIQVLDTVDWADRATLGWT